MSTRVMSSAASRKERIAAMRAARGKTANAIRPSHSFPIPIILLPSGSGRRLLSSDEEVCADPSKSPSENVVEALRQLVERDDGSSSKTKRLAYLNALVQMWQAVQQGQDDIKLKEVLMW